MSPTDGIPRTAPVDEDLRFRGVIMATSEASADDLDLIASIRSGDEAAFISLVDRFHSSLIRVAQLYVADRTAAEDVAQETWIGVLRGLERFEARSSLKTWIFRILVNRAKTRAQRDGRTIAFSELWDPGAEPDEPAVPPDRFLASGQWQGHWASPVQSWGEAPEERLLSDETLERVRAAVEALPPTQREVITLRDIEGWSAPEVCHTLGITETNQRVLLHRARSRVRRAIEGYVNGD
jgi:RNA polymerase sigma-70 factor (ECF subfamily)